MNTEKNAGRVAGLWYLSIALFYSFSMIYVDSVFYVPGDLGATVSNIHGGGLVFRLGLLSCLIGHICFIFLVNALYRLFEGVDRNLARQMVFLVLAGVAVAFLNRLNQLAAILLLDDGVSLSAFAVSQREALAMFFLELHRNGERIASLFWALWLFPLGLLIHKSDLIPKAFAFLLIAAGASYLVGFILNFFLPDLAAPTKTLRSVVETGAELSFIVWLLIRGAKPRERRPAVVEE